MVENLDIGAGVTIPSHDLSWTSVRSSGPGGQHVNKVATKVELRFDLAGTHALSPAAKAQVYRVAKNRINNEGAPIITSQESRSRAQNLGDALEKLAALIRGALKPRTMRRPTKPTKASKQKRLTNKRRTAERKQKRSKIRTDES